MENLDHKDNRLCPGLHYRSVLEVLKMCQPQKVMSIYSRVQKSWMDASASRELWVTFLENFRFRYDPSTHPKTTFLMELHRQKPRTIVALTPKSIAVFNPKAAKWTLTWLSRHIDSLDFAYVMLWYGSVLCCGGNGSERAVCTIAPDGQVTREPDLITGRLSHGLVSYGNKVFVFGGWNDPRYVLQNEVIEEESRSPLPNLRLPRYHFTPCVHQSRIYLCGGHNSSVEVFDPNTLSLGVLSGATLPERLSSCISTVYKGALVMLTEGYVTKWDFQSRILTVKMKQHSTPLASPMNVTQYQDLIYVRLPTKPYGIAIEIETGRIRSFPRIA